MKNLVLDVNVILDLWLCRVPADDLLNIANLIAGSHAAACQCCVSSSSLPVLEYVTRRELKKSGTSPEHAIERARSLVNDLASKVQLLSNYGFEQADALNLSSDQEDAQIVLAASSLHAQTAIVTNEKRFQTDGKVAQIAPHEVSKWLQATASGRPLEFCDLAAQQDRIRPALERNIHRVLHHGQDRRYHHIRVGVNSRLDTLQAAILLPKLAVFDNEIALRQQVAARYSALLPLPLGEGGGEGSITSIILPHIEPHNTSVYAQYTIRVQDRAAVQENLKAAGIPTAVHYPIPLNKQPAVADAAVQLPKGDEAAEQLISLPMHPYLSQADQKIIVAATRAI